MSSSLGQRNGEISNVFKLRLFLIAFLLKAIFLLTWRHSLLITKVQRFSLKRRTKEHQNHFTLFNQTRLTDSSRFCFCYFTLFSGTLSMFTSQVSVSIQGQQFGSTTMTKMTLFSVGNYMGLDTVQTFLHLKLADNWNSNKTDNKKLNYTLLHYCR